MVYRSSSHQVMIANLSVFPYELFFLLIRFPLTKNNVSKKRFQSIFLSSWIFTDCRNFSQSRTLAYQMNEVVKRYPHIIFPGDHISLKCSSRVLFLFKHGQKNLDSLHVSQWVQIAFLFQRLWKATQIAYFKHNFNSVKRFWKFSVSRGISSISLTIPWRDFLPIGITK